MASERFLNLPEEKRMAVISAAVEEFISNPYDKVSINKIIEKAGISRGSFYTYFEDKSDLLSFITDNLKMEQSEYSVDFLKKHDGDFWGLMEGLLEDGMTFCKENHFIDFFHSIVLYPDALLREHPPYEEIAKQMTMIYEYVDHDLFRDGSLEYFQFVADNAFLMLTSSIVGFFVNPQNEEDIKKDFKDKMSLLRYGACKSQKM